MASDAIDTAPNGKYREALPDLQSGKFAKLPHHDAHSWELEFYKNPFAKTLVENWRNLWAEPFCGLTTDGMRLLL